VGLFFRPRRLLLLLATGKAMATSRERAGILVRAIEASMVGDSEVIAELYTDDVRGWSAGTTVSSAPELAVEFEDREDTFSDVELEVTPLDVSGNHACAEWVATATFSRPLAVDDDGEIEPTGERVTIRGVTVAEFEHDRICAFRQYWDEAALVEQLAHLSQ
jgi:ketosteroid isomerase-like protein